MINTIELNLLKTISSFIKVGVTFWTSSGTTLGIVRCHYHDFNFCHMFFCLYKQWAEPWSICFNCLVVLFPNPCQAQRLDSLGRRPGHLCEGRGIPTSYIHIGQSLKSNWVLWKWRLRKSLQEKDQIWTPECFLLKQKIIIVITIETYLDQDEPLLKNVGDMLEANGLCLVIDHGDDDDYDDGW